MRKKSRDEGGQDRIRMDSPADLQRWSEHFGVTPVEVKTAVGAVGAEAAAVRRYLHEHEPHGVAGASKAVAAAERNLGVAPTGRAAAPVAANPERPTGSAAPYGSGHGKPQSTDETELAAPRPTKSAGAALGAAAGAVAGGAAGIVGGPAGIAAGAAAGAALGGGAGLASAKADKPAHGGDERPQRSSKRRG